MASKTVTLKAFRLENSANNLRDIKYKEELVRSLENLHPVRSRLQPLSNRGHESEHDFIPFYKHESDHLYFIYARLREGAALGIFSAQLEADEISLEQFKATSEKDIMGALKDVSYCLIYNNIFISCSAHIQPKSIAAYISTVLKSGNPIHIEKLLTSVEKMLESPIKLITIGDTEELLLDDKVQEKISERLHAKKRDFQMLVETNRVKATLILAFKRDTDGQQESMSKLKSVLRSGAFPEKVRIVLFNGRTLKGSDLEEKTRIEIETPSAGSLNELQLKEEMLAYAKSLQP